MTPEDRVGKGVVRESEDGKKGILRFGKTIKDPLLYFNRVERLIGGFGREGKADFRNYRGVEIPTTDEWLNEIAIWQLTEWITGGIDKHYSGNDNLGIVLSLLLGKAMKEGIKNALEHGNKENPKKKVLIKWKLGNTDISISIIDEGTEIIDLTPKSHIAGDLLEEVFSGAGNGVKIIKRCAEALGGIVTWDSVNNKDGRKIGTELKIQIPFQPR